MIDARTNGPSAVRIGFSPTSTGNSVPSLRRPKSSRPAPIGRLAGAVEEAVAQGGVPVPEPWRHQRLDGLAEQLLRLVPEQGLRLGVGQDDPAVPARP